MFISQLSGKVYGPHVKPERVVVERRPQHYRNSEGVESEGWEIVRELVVGPDEVEKCKSQ